MVVQFYYLSCNQKYRLFLAWRICPQRGSTNPAGNALLGAVAAGIKSALPIKWLIIIFPFIYQVGSALMKIRIE